LVLTFGLLLGAGLLFVPTHITVLGTSGSCGVPIVRAFAPNNATDEIERELIDQCKSQSVARVIAGALLGGIAVTAGALMLHAGRAGSGGAGLVRSVWAPGWYPDPTRRNPLRYWNGNVWSPHVSDGQSVKFDP
jgi:hypothetical protein